MLWEFIQPQYKTRKCNHAILAIIPANVWDRVSFTGQNSSQELNPVQSHLDRILLRTPDEIYFFLCPEHLSTHSCYESWPPETQCYLCKARTYFNSIAPASITPSWLGPAGLVSGISIDQLQQLSLALIGASQWGYKGKYTEVSCWGMLGYCKHLRHEPKDDNLSLFQVDIKKKKSK